MTSTFLRAVNDLLNAMDVDKKNVLLLLDLSAVLDTIDHQILLSSLENFLGIRSTVTALQWFRSYLLDRKQRVLVNSFSSSLLKFGVPQGSVLESVLFDLYATPLSDFIANH